MEQTPSQATWLHRLVSVLGTGYLHFVGKTSFLQKINDPEYLSLFRDERPLIYAFWHNTQVFLAYYHRGEKINTLVSRSKDGEYIAQVMKRLNLSAVRGSTSRGGPEAFREIVDCLKKGEQAGFTPDGPRGPLQSVGSGVVLSAQMTGAPIIPLSLFSRRKKIFKSWDQFQLPLPFGVNVVVHGKPLYLKKEEDLESAKQKVREAINKVSEEATLAGAVIPSWFSLVFGDLLYFLYNFAVVLLLPIWAPLTAVFYGFRRSSIDVKERLGGGKNFPATSRPLVFHAASLGEWQALKPLVAKFKELKNQNLLITVSTPEAKKIISKEEPDVTVRFLPLDLPWVMAQWVEKINPSAFFIVETEIWPNLINGLYERHVPVFLLNGRLSSRSAATWKFFKPFFSSCLRRLSWLYVRSPDDGRRFVELGGFPNHVTITGNMKCDTLKIREPQEKKELRKRYFGLDEGIYAIGGSTWPGEEKTLLTLFSDASKNKLRLILAPRRPERFGEMEKLLSAVPQSWSKWSTVKNTKEWSTDILLVDTLGDLKDLYPVADVAFIGGSLFPKGGQNPLEAAAGRLALVFGPSMGNFRQEETLFKKCGAARQARHEADLLKDLAEIVGDESLCHSMGEAAAQLVREMQGATEKTVQQLKSQLNI